jgi:hypothetical protein
MSSQDKHLLEGELLPAAGPLALPHYADETLQTLTVAELVELLVEDEDRVPLAVIEECARRGAEMETRLAECFATPAHDESRIGMAWLPLHAINILGLMSSDTAGVLLLTAMQWLEQNDELLANACAGYWHAWFRNKSALLLDKLRIALADRASHAEVRSDLVQALMGVAAQRGKGELDAELDFLARFVTDDSEDFGMCMLVAQALLDFPRDRHRSLIEELARLEGASSAFTPADIEARFNSGTDEPEWKHFEDPLEFYSSDSIQHRLQLADFEIEADDPFEEDFFADAVPYVRETPKVGRNDPCPCGSAKKYKKCCLESGA